MGLVTAPLPAPLHGRLGEWEEGGEDGARLNLLDHRVWEKPLVGHGWVNDVEASICMTSR